MNDNVNTNEAVDLDLDGLKQKAINIFLEAAKEPELWNFVGNQATYKSMMISNPAVHRNKHVSLTFADEIDAPTFMALPKTKQKLYALARYDDDSNPFYRAGSGGLAYVLINEPNEQVAKVAEMLFVRGVEVTQRRIKNKQYRNLEGALQKFYAMNNTKEEPSPKVVSARSSKTRTQKSS